MMHSLGVIMWNCKSAPLLALPKILPMVVKPMRTMCRISRALRYARRSEDPKQFGRILARAISS
jgi:hypothetical protein